MWWWEQFGGKNRGEGLPEEIGHPKAPMMACDEGTKKGPTPKGRPDSRFSLTDGGNDICEHIPLVFRRRESVFRDGDKQSITMCQNE